MVTQFTIHNVNVIVTVAIVTIWNIHKKVTMSSMILFQYLWDEDNERTFGWAVGEVRLQSSSLVRQVLESIRSGKRICEHGKLMFIIQFVVYGLEI